MIAMEVGGDPGDHKLKSQNETGASSALRTSNSVGFVRCNIASEKAGNLSRPGRARQSRFDLKF
jgi:hypothetical protein